jgi:pimeloyl-ACP methyl ester carboxylesterase
MGETAAGAPGQFVRANSIDIYYEEYGIGPPLVMLHGGTGTIDHDPVFGAHFRVIAPNIRGHGRTANPTGRCSYAVFADDVAALIDALGLDRPLVAGYSDGGNTALQLGMTHPESAQALVLGGTWHRLTPTYFEGMRQMLGLVSDDTFNLTQLAETHPGLVSYWQAAHAALGGSEYWKTLLQQMWPMWTTPLDYTEADFQRITAPTLVLIGDRDETILVEDAMELYRLIPGAELGVIPAASHLLEGRGPLYGALAVDFLLRAQNAA